MFFVFSSNSHETPNLFLFHCRVICIVIVFLIYVFLLYLLLCNMYYYFTNDYGIVLYYMH